MHHRPSNLILGYACMKTYCRRTLIAFYKGYCELILSDNYFPWIIRYYKPITWCFINHLIGFTFIWVVRIIDEYLDMWILHFIITLLLQISEDEITRTMSPFVIFLLILTVTTTLLQGVVLKYKIWWSNCSSVDTFVTKSAPSLLACALFCTQSSVCKSFAWRDGKCGLSGRCPWYCDQATEDKDGWDVI